MMDDRIIRTLCWSCSYCRVDAARQWCVYREQCVSRGIQPEPLATLERCPMEDR
jgi:hypothetical protein